MKTRNGFVSNSSSSSFVFVGFPTVELNSDLTNEQKVRGRFTQREIDKYAIENLGETDYSNYRKGNIPSNFWENAYRHFESDIEYTEDLPENYEKHAVWSSGESVWWQGLCIASVSESGSQEFNPIEISKAKQKIKKDYPNVTPRVVLIAIC